MCCFSFLNSTRPDLKKGKKGERTHGFVSHHTEHESHIWAKMTYGMDRCLTLVREREMKGTYKRMEIRSKENVEEKVEHHRR